jgi:ABC-type nitrate/sulfonate/bicarbonate transport system ATPase subunit
MTVCRCYACDPSFGALDHQARERVQEPLLGIWEEQRMRRRQRPSPS